MRRNWLVAIGVLVLIALLVAYWQFGRKGGSAGTREPPGEIAGGSAHGGGRTSVVKSRAPATPATLAGRVTRKLDGAGVPGAIISLGRAELDTMFGGEDEETITITTDPQGAWSAPSVPPGRYTIAATAKGLVPGSLDKLVVAEGEHRTGVDLVLETGGTLVRGTVSDVGGGPVPGARLSFERDRDTPFGSPELIAIAGADGSYELTLGDGDYTAKATHEDYTRAARDVEVGGTPLTVDFVLSPGGAIRGVVVTRDGATLPGAMVIASAGHHRGGGGGTTRTNDKGEFALRSLGSGAISITAAGRGFASEQPTVVELGIGEQVEGVRVIVDRAFSISGSVVETGTAKGISGVRLGAFSIASGQMAMAPDPSDADGTFEIVGVRPASYMLFAIGETTMPEIGKPVEVIDQDITGLTIEMGSGVTVSGRVEPGAIAEISIAPTQVGIGNVFEAIKALLVRAQSDPTGAFVLHHVPPGSFTLEAKVVDGRAGRVPLLVDKADKTGVVVKLEPRAQVSGKVVDDKGTPVPRVRVTVSPKGDADKGFSMSMSSNSERGALTGSDGTFRVIGLDEGPHDIEVTDDQGQIPWADAAHKAKPKEPVEPVVLVLAAAEQRTGVTLTIEARDGVIKGVVRGADGKPVADAWVTASVEGEIREELVMEGETEIMDRGSKPPTLTGSDGAFTFTNLRRAEYTLVAETAKGTARVEKKNVKLGANVTLTLAPLGSLTGHVTLNGAPATSYMLSCDRTGPMPRRFASPDGTYTMERIPPGHVTCTANADAGRGTAEIDVPAGPATLDLALTPWATITGTVVSVLTGQPIAGLKLIASGNDFSAGAMTDTLSGKGPTSDAAGRFTIPQVAAGKGSVSVMPKDAGFVELARREYEVAPGQRLELGAIKVVPPRTGDAGTLGLSVELTLDDKGEALVVSAVKPGGPAEVGGVRIGDKLVAINGVPVATLTPKLAQTLVSSGSVTIDQRYQLTLDRSGTAVTVVLVGVRW